MPICKVTAQPIDDIDDVEPLVFLMETGTATVEEITELFCAFSDLYRAFGGKGLKFHVPDRKTDIDSGGGDG